MPGWPTGSLPALVTPLASPGELDLDGLGALVRGAVADGASGVLVAGTTGEGTLLQPEQRAEITRAAVAAADGATVIGCASGPTVTELHRDVARLARAGADPVLVLAPAIQPLTPDELVDLHLAVAEDTPVATLVYHIPQLTGSALTPDALRELAGHDGIVGMKDSSPDAERRAAFARAAGTRFGVLTGHAPTLHAALEAGVAGSILAIANIRQRQVVRLHAAVEAGDGAEAEALQGALSRTVTAVAQLPWSTPAVLKAALQLEGLVAERWSRPPLRSVPTHALDQVRTALLR